jgi:hypothetical protein
MAGVHHGAIAADGDVDAEARYMSCLTETAPWAVRPQEEATFPEPIEVRAMHAL